MSRSAAATVLALVSLGVFIIPLFLGLDRWDIENDESIYSYAVERMVDTGEWLTPRYVATDGTFVEKPPLKFWIVAGAMALGIVPENQFGMRVFDALFGAVAFGYIMAFGWRLAGVTAGSIALLLLVSFRPLLFEHGLRTNNMESALFLSYTAGLFHFALWAGSQVPPARKLHALATVLFFVLGFMTKFVAAVFLPLVALVALVASGGANLLASRWRDWRLPVAVALMLVLPWFVYQSIVRPEEFWATIFGAHVYTRMTTFVDPAHVRPWHFYLSEIWIRMPAWGSQAVVAAGFGYMVWRSGQRDGSMARLLLAWAVVPLILISAGSSKVTHYAFPFLPPFALAAGWACAQAARWADQYFEAPPTAVSGRARRPPLRSTLHVLALLMALAALVIAALTYYAGEPLTVTAGDVRLFRNSSVLRPVLIAAALLFLVGHAKGAVRTAVVGILVLLLPVHAYSDALRLAMSVRRPMFAVRNCMSRLIDADPDLKRGVYLSDPFEAHLAIHPLYYHFRHSGPWLAGMEYFDREIRVRLTTPDRPAPMLLSDVQYEELSSRPGGPTAVPAVGISPGVVMLLPGPYAPCAAEAIAAGGTAPR